MPKATNGEGKSVVVTAIHVEDVEIYLDKADDPFSQRNLAMTERLLAGSVRFLHSFLLHMCVGGMLSG